MYARGEISSETYHRLLEMARSDQLSWDDLKRVHSDRRLTIRPQSDSQPARERSPEIITSLNKLYRHRSRLETAQAETETVLERLETDAAKLHEQAETAAEKAELALPNETTARAYLETKQQALARVDELEKRITTLRGDLRRINTLRDELATREAELKALESGEQLAELEASIREDLLNDR
jgi:DNA repair exonuclease SbcCD ATPase subunit